MAEETSDEYDGVDTFVQGIGTVRECRHCGALIAGGPTSCVHCAKEWVQLGNKLNKLLVGGFWSLYWRSPRLRAVLRKLPRVRQHRRRADD